MTKTDSRHAARRWWPVIPLVLALCAPPFPAAAAGAASGGSAEQQRALFQEGWNAARRGDQRRVLEIIRDLDGYVLSPYLEFELLRQRVDRVPEDVILEFLARHRDWSFAGTLETQWLRALGRRAEWRTLLAHGADSSDVEVRCHHARALLETGQHDNLAPVARELWLAPGSRPNACDPVFAWWRREHGISAADAWTRFELAVGAGETSLASYIRRYLPEADRPWADRWLELARQPVPTLRAARQWPDDARARGMLAPALTALAARDWKRADQEWQVLRARFAWSDSQAGRISRQIALFRAVDLDAGALDAIDALPADQRDQQMLEWRLRAALAARDWAQVLASAEAMPSAERLRGRWRYWQARALGELQRPEAVLYFAGLAAEANYYGFLAADRIGGAYPLCIMEIQPDAELQRRLARDAEIERALELFHVGQRWHARRTWAQATRRMAQADLRQAALLAAAAGWHERAIFALGEAGAMAAYPWRFPMIERNRVEDAARRYQVDAAWVYGLMRAESAMQPDAISPAGARGLLQLMPASAEEIARRQGLPLNSAADLLEPAVNIPLGVAHLGELQQRFGNDPLKVAAAYNAGIRSVERWMDSRPHNEADIWIETLPFYETRDYVPRVLAFTTLYDWLMEGRPRPLSARMGLPWANGDERAEVQGCDSGAVE